MKNNNILKSSQYSSISKVEIDLDALTNNEKISETIKNNLEEQKQISQSSPAYIFCKSLKEINSLNENGWTPLYRAIMSSNNLALEELLKLGADPNISNNLGETPLYLCVEKQNYYSLNKLLENGADGNIQKKNGNTPLHLAFKKKLENKFIIELLKHKANPNIINKLYNQTPTHLALINKYDEEVLKILKDKNANIYEIKDKYDKTPFDYSKELNDNEYLNKIIQIFGKKIEKTVKRNSIKLVEINLDDNIKIEFPKENDINIFSSDSKTKEINLPNLNQENDKYNSNKIMYNSNNDLINDDIINKINNLKILINNPNTSNKNIESNKKNNKDFFEKNEIYEDINDINKKNEKDKKESIPKNISELNYLSNSSEGFPSKKDFNLESKNIISLPSNMNIEKNNSNIDEKISVISKHNNQSINNFSINISKPSEKNINNLLSSNKNINSESLCYSLSKDISETKNQEKTQKKRESDNDIEINNKIFSSETDKEIIKTIISATEEKNKISKNNSNNIEKNPDIHIFMPENLTEEILDKEDKRKELEKNNNYTKTKEKQEKMPIEKKEEDHNFSLSNNSNLFSEMRMNSTNSNFNKTNKEEDKFKDFLGDNEFKISKISNNNINNTLFNKNNDEQKAEQIYKKNSEINSINNINNHKTKEIEIIKNEYNNKNISKDEKNSHINKNIKEITDKDKTGETIQNQEEKNNSQINSNSKQTLYYNESNRKNEENKNNKEQCNIITNEEENLTDITNKIVNMLREERNIKIKKENKENENPNKLKIQIYKNKNFLAERNYKKDSSINKVNKTKVITYKQKENLIYNNYNKFSNYKINDIFKSKSINKKNRNILYNKQKIYRHSSPDYNNNYHRNINKENLVTENSFRNNTSFISILNTNNISNNKNNNINIRKINPMFYEYDSCEENINKNNSNIIIERNKNMFNNKNLIFEQSTMNNTTHSSFYNKTYSRNYIKPLMNTNSLKTNSFSNNSNCNSFRNSNNHNNNSLLKNKSNNNYFQMNIIKPGRYISNNLLIRLRDWLISCDLLCYYNILVKNNIYNIERWIEDIRYNRINVSFKDIEELGIKKPGHIFRLLLKLEVDSGKIDNNLYNYIIEKFNINIMTNNGVLTSSINDINCCGMNLCSTNTHYNRRITINNTYYDNNYYDENKTNETENECEENEINYVDIFSFLKKNNLWKFKENFIHNGFDQIEYILIQLFSHYYFDKNILNDYMHIYLEEDKNKVLKILYKEKKKLCLLLGIRYNSEQLKQILLSQSSNTENYNNYMNSSLPVNTNNNNKDNCCSIY